MAHAAYFRGVIDKEDDLENLSSILNKLNSEIGDMSSKLEKNSKNFQRINLATELKALKLVLSFGSGKIKNLKKD